MKIQTVIRKVLSLVLSFAMILSGMNFGVHAKTLTKSAWEKIDYQDITSTDTIAITMTSSEGVTYVLPAATSTKVVPAIVGNVEANQLTVEGSQVDLGWKIQKIEDGMYITNDAGEYFYTTASNSGSRVGNTQQVWHIDETSGYLAATDSANVVRYLGVYLVNPDWRAYNNTTNNTKNQTLAFYKYLGVVEDTPEVPDLSKVTPSATGEIKEGSTITLQTASFSNVSYEVSFDGENFSAISGNTYTIPMGEPGNYELSIRATDGTVTSQVLKLTYVIEAAKEPYVTKATKLTDVQDGAWVYIYSVSGNNVLTSQVSGKKLAGSTAVDIVEDTFTTTNDMTLVKVNINEDQQVTFTSADGKYLTSGATGNALTFENEANDYSLWTLENAVVNDENVYFIKNVNAKYNGNVQSLEYYSGYTVYGHKDTAAYAFNFYTPVLADGAMMIADSKALANNEQAKVTGIVTYVSGKNVYVQDATGAICLYFTTAPTDIQVGDYVVASGSKTVYNGLQELTGVVEYNIEGSGELTSTTTTIADLLADQEKDSYLECTIVHINEVTLGDINSSGNTPISDDEGNTINLYKAPASILSDAKKGDKVSITGVVSDFKGYQIFLSALTIIEKAQEETPEVPEEPAGLPEVIADGTYVIWNPNYKVTVANKVNGSNYYIGDNVKGTIDAVEGYSNDSLWNVKKVEDGYTFEQNGKYYGVTSGGKITVDENPANKVWKVTLTEDQSYYNLNCGGKYLEWYASYSDWSMYGTIKESDQAMFTMWFTPASQVYEVNGDIVNTITSWAGSASEYTTGSVVYGDALAVGDQKSTADTFTPYVNGSAVQAYTTGTGVAYMGGTGLGSGNDDYMLFTTSSKGYGAMSLSFRLRASNTGAGVWQVQYSTDGTTYTNFTTGSYKCSYTNYSGETPTPVTLEGAISDGKAKTSIKAASYISFNFDVPSNAANAQNLYIRLVPENTSNAKGEEKAPSTGGTVRIDNVILQGSPIISDDIVSLVVVSPDGVDEDQIPGTPLEMATATANASIYYRFVHPNGSLEEAWMIYDANNQPVVPENLPAILQVKATMEGKQDSIISTYTYSAGSVANVKVTPNGGGIYIANEQDSIQVTLDCETEGATIYYSTSQDEQGNDIYQEYTSETSISLAKGFGSFTLKAYATKDGYKDSHVITRKFTERNQETYNIFFGQMHSHTSYSDGAGSANDAFDHADDVENLDFLAVTDHSNSFDNAGNGVLAEDASNVSAEWKEGKELAQKYTTKDFVGLFGFEMTWSNGLGHINTFNTPGFQSRTQAEYSTYATALQNYYATLKTVNESISQFNHPGTTFGDFSDFAYYDEELDQLITLIEVGNGEGTIGSSSYFPSYEYYTRALDKGWHVAPTNNQDNHKGLWGDANTARSIVLCDTLDEESIYDAMRNYRVYASEDNDLAIYYTLNDQIMGTILGKDDVEDTLTINVSLKDLTDRSIGKVEVIVNGGLSIASKEVASSDEMVTFNVGSNYSYYYIKVTQSDGDIAVTAPVWVGEVEAVGISTFKTTTPLAVQDEVVDLNLEVYNNETKPLEINKIEFTVMDASDETSIIKTLEGEELINASMNKVGKLSTSAYSFDYTYGGLGKTTYTVSVYGTLNGVEKVYTEKLELNYVSKAMVTNVVIDGTHYNDYVTGYYGGNMTHFKQLAADESVKVTVAGEEKSAADRSYTQDEWQALLDDCALLIVSAPARNSGTANLGDYSASLFEDWFIDLVKDYVDHGGSVIVCGLADYQDSKSSAANYHTSAQLNRLLEAIGSTMRVNDDEVYDEVNNGGQAYRLYPENFNMDSPWLQGVITNNGTADYQKYSQYSGCTVNPGKGTALVSGFDTTYSVDSDKDGVGNNGESTGSYNTVVAKGDVHFLAVESTPANGHIFAAGGVFVSDFEVDYELDNAFDLPYANTTIAKNIIKAAKVELPVTSIQEVRDKANAGENGSVYRIQGNVTVARDIEQNAFFDCIYVQDETAGIDIFPFADDSIKLGAKVDITGYIDSYQGDLELKVMSYKIVDNENVTPIEPTLLSCKEASDYVKNGGLLTKVEGTVKEGSIYYNADGTLAQFVVVDETGETTIFIDGYILSATTNTNTLASFIQANAKVSAVGVQYMHPEVFVEGVTENVSVLRVRNCDEIILLEAPHTHVYTPVFNWNEDGSVQVVFGCECGDQYTLDATVTEEITIEPTTSSEGQKVITATVVGQDGVTYTDTTTIVVPKLEETPTDPEQPSVDPENPGEQPPVDPENPGEQTPTDPEQSGETPEQGGTTGGTTTETTPNVGIYHNMAYLATTMIALAGVVYVSKKKKEEK